MQGSSFVFCSWVSRCVSCGMETRQHHNSVSVTIFLPGAPTMCTTSVSKSKAILGFRLEGGTRCGGSSSGRSCPLLLTRMRCMASANSSSSRQPSLSMSDSCQILRSIDFGSFDFTISVLAAEMPGYVNVGTE